MYMRKLIMEQEKCRELSVDRKLRNEIISENSDKYIQNSEDFERVKYKTC